MCIVFKITLNGPVAYLINGRFPNSRSTNFVKPNEVITYEIYNIYD